MLTAKDIREQFLTFFEARGHRRVASSPLIPGNDPTLMFTNAGMNQFKDYFTGSRPAPFPTATSSQKCVRAGGKHNDLENVGFTARHHTFFEMLGNFSFGDYFKKDACMYAWDFVTNYLKLDDTRLYPTVFEKDDEAFEIWRDIVGVPENRIHRMGEKDNFWAMGDTGPCGPCSEILYDQGEGPGGIWKDADIYSDADRYLEIWNLVFMQYERHADGSMHPLPRPSIDTGAGLERMTALCQQVYTNYDTDLFLPIIHGIADQAGKKYGTGSDIDVSLRVIADHARASSFLITDNVFPSNDGRGYVLRRIMRRAIRHGKKLGIEKPFFAAVCDSVISHMSDAYPELQTNRDTVLNWVETEENTFRQTLGRGLKTLETVTADLKQNNSATIGGEVVFCLYDQDGFPPDLTVTIAAEHAMGIYQQGFEAHMERQRQRGPASWKETNASLTEMYTNMYQALGGTRFVGYDVTEAQGIITGLTLEKSDDNNAAVYTETTTARAGDTVHVVVDVTPFYGESGGQVGDTVRMISSGGAELDVLDTQKPHLDFPVHICTVQKGFINIGDTVDLRVDTQRRDRIRANHSVTHLLHYALRSVLGDHVKQSGSYVTPERMRFDFSHFKGLSAEEIRQVEDVVNRLVRENAGITTDVLSIEEARNRGAIMFFGDKYGDVVRMVSMGPSMELCGGTHARRTGDIGVARIVSEGAVAAGMRRIEMLTAQDAMTFTLDEHKVLQEALALLHVPADQAGSRIEQLQADIKEREKKIKELEQNIARSSTGDLESQVTRIGALQVLATEVPPMDGKALRDFAFEMRDKIGDDALVVLVSKTAQDKVSIVVTAGSAVAGTAVHAGNLMSKLAPIVGGRGGGRPDGAQGGGTDVQNVGTLLKQVPELLKA